MLVSATNCDQPRYCRWRIQLHHTQLEPNQAHNMFILTAIIPALIAPIIFILIMMECISKKTRQDAIRRFWFALGGGILSTVVFIVLRSLHSIGPEGINFWLYYIFSAGFTFGSLAQNFYHIFLRYFKNDAPSVEETSEKQGTSKRIKFPFTLSFSWWKPFVFGGIYGLLQRMIYSGDGNSNSILATMSLSFAVLVPFAIGAITIYWSEKSHRRTYKYYFFAPWISVGLAVIGTAITLLEGSICIAMALPLFLMLGSAGGLTMGFICRNTSITSETVKIVAAFPFLMAIGEINMPAQHFYTTESNSIFIEAPPHAIWQNINYPLNIRPTELTNGFAYFIGVPYPIEARTLTTGIGGVRHLIWQKGVTFDEDITEWEDNKKISWKYRFNDNSFPKGSMDDHIVIGGKYFDLINTSYTLTPERNGTRLSIDVGYRVTTKFNWYAKPWAKFLIINTSTSILNFYKNRSEAQIPITLNAVEN